MSESLLDQAPMGIAVLGANGYFFAAYARLKEFITPERHRTIFDITPHYLHARLRQQLTMVKRTGESFSTQIPLLDKERNIRWMQLTIENGNAYRLIAYLFPIDQYKSLQDTVLMLGNEPINLEHTVSEIAGLVNCDVVCVVQEDNQVAAFWKDGEVYRDVEYVVAASPCASVMRKRDAVYIPMHVQTRYPEARTIRRMGMHGYFGIPVIDGEKAVAVISIMSRDTLILDDLHVAILRLFAMRAAGVLRYNSMDN